MSHVGGRRGQEAFTHMSKLHLLCTQENNPGFWGRGLVKRGGPGAPDRARFRAGLRDLGSEVDGNYPRQRESIQEICLVDGASMGGVRGLWDHQGSLWAATLRLLDLKETC